MKLLDKLTSWLTRYPDPKTRLYFDDRDTARTATDEKPHRVTIYDDDVTPMNYVFYILHSHFLMDEKEAQETVLKIHNEGSAVVFRTDEKSARWLVQCVAKENAKHGYSLKCDASLEKGI